MEQVPRIAIDRLVTLHHRGDSQKSGGEEPTDGVCSTRYAIFPISITVEMRKSRWRDLLISKSDDEQQLENSDSLRPGAA